MSDDGRKEFHCTVYLPDGTKERRSVRMKAEPTYDEIKRFVQPIIGSYASTPDDPERVFERLEHVNIMAADGTHADMFVSELGHVQLATRAPLPHNAQATVEYRRNWLTQHPEADPESLPTIAGPAVVFDERVWF